MESVRILLSKVVTGNKHTEPKAGLPQTESKATGRKPYSVSVRHLCKTGIVLEQLILGLDCQVALSCNLVGQSKKLSVNTMDEKQIDCEHTVQPQVPKASQRA